MAALALCVLAAAGVDAGSAPTVLELTHDTMLGALNRHRRIVVLMYRGKKCKASRLFQPWLFALAHRLPGVQFARVDATEGEGSIADAFGVTSSPTIKAFQRTKPKGERVTDYTGPVDFDSLLEWGEAIADDKVHRYSAVGIEPGSSGGGDDGGGGGGGGDGGGGDGSRDAGDGTAAGDPPPTAARAKGMPESVRRMAETMVREKRLQRLLAARGAEASEAYSRRVTARYEELAAAAGVDPQRTTDQFSVQELNRRARDLVRDEVLAEAPDEVRREVLAEVNVGRKPV